MSIGRLSIYVEFERRNWWWKPWRDLVVERDPYLQNYYNSLWHLCVGWLCFSAEINWGVT